MGVTRLSLHCHLPVSLRKREMPIDAQASLCIYSRQFLCDSSSTFNWSRYRLRISQ
jgi:hypothetical protein